jgi:hypothetical protein
MAACCLHIRVSEQSALEGQRIQQAVAGMLQHDFHISHSTIQEAVRRYVRLRTELGGSPE